MEILGLKLSKKLNCILISQILIMFGFGDTLFSATTLPKPDQQAALKAAGFSFRGKQVLNGCDEAADVKMNALDLNRDGILELFIQDFSGMCYGIAGANLVLVIKDSKGHWNKNLDFSASGYKLLSSRNKGFPDIEIEGPGFCNGIWRWNGAKYEYKCSREQEPGGCAREGVKIICK